MKHLKKYKIFEIRSNSSEAVEVESTINDILYELSDEYFETACIAWELNGGKLSFEISIGKSDTVPDGHGGVGSKTRERFGWSDISDTMDRLCNYIFIMSSKAKFDFESNNGTYTSIEYNNPNDLLLDMRDKFPEYYDELEGWFRLGFVIELKSNMKHLKSYKLIEGLSHEIESTIDDIALDINDEGCYIDYDIDEYGNYGTINILSRDEDYIDEDGYKDLGRFKVENIIPYIKRIYDYLESEGYKCMIICPMIFDKIETKDRTIQRYKDVTFGELEEYKDVDVMSVIIKLNKA